MREYVELEILKTEREAFVRAVARGYAGQFGEAFQERRDDTPMRGADRRKDCERL